MNRYTEMTKNLVDSISNVEIPSLKLDTNQYLAGIADCIESSALEIGKVGDRPYRVNSVNISLRQP